MRHPSSPAIHLTFIPAALLLVASGCDRPTTGPSPEESLPPAPASAPAAPVPSGPLPGPWASALGPEPSASVAAAPAEAVPTYAPGREVVGAIHILIAYKGAAGAPPTVTRTKDEARKLAVELRERILDNKATFEELVPKYTDDALSRNTGGAVGSFERYAMPRPFSDAAFGMQVGSLSEAVETERGFHIIRRIR
ncbi:MAG: peptidylprolyl isomerase [Byssovorax sp.]